MEDVKMCKECGETKPLSAFYYHNKNGVYFGKCKECKKAEVRANRANKVEYYRNYDRLRYDEQGVRGEPMPSEKQREFKKAWEQRNKHKKHASTTVNNALRDGKLEKQPCSVCGSNEDIEAHHEDYSKPLDVVWLCTYHHGLTRRKPRVNETKRRRFVL